MTGRIQLERYTLRASCYAMLVQKKSKEEKYKRTQSPRPTMHRPRSKVMLTALT